MNTAFTAADSSAWIKQVSAGNAAELAVAAALKRRGWQVRLNVEPGGHDLTIYRTVEIKADAKAVLSGKVAVEVSSGGRPSGLASSLADLWAFVIGEEALLVPTASLRAAIAAGSYQIVPACERGKNQIVLVPVEHVRRMPGARVIQLPVEGGVA